MTALSEPRVGEPGVATPVLALRNIHKSFRQGVLPWGHRVGVLNGASLDVAPGQLVGLVGENGSGKTTLMLIAAGMLRPDSGSVQLASRIGYCPQIPLLWDKLTVDEHFRLLGSAYHMTELAVATAVERLYEELSFARYRGYRVESLSGGTRQKLNLALALMHEPGLLLLDEPYAGFDWETYTHFWEMAEARRDNGMGIMIVSHLISERSRLDRIYTLQDGVCG